MKNPQGADQLAGQTKNSFFRKGAITNELTKGSSAVTFQRDEATSLKLTYTEYATKRRIINSA